MNVINKLAKKSPLVFNSLDAWEKIGNVDLCLFFVDFTVILPASMSVLSLQLQF